MITRPNDRIGRSECAILRFMKLSVQNDGVRDYVTNVDPAIFPNKAVPIFNGPATIGSVQKQPNNALPIYLIESSLAAKFERYELVATLDDNGMVELLNIYEL